jgi:dihydroxyacetone kinase-like predicted kinase
MMNKEIKKCVLEIIDSLCERNGFDDWWYNLDEDITNEIQKEIEEIIEKRLNKVQNEQME